MDGDGLVRCELLDVAELRTVLDTVTYKDWRLNVYLGRHEGVHLQIRGDVDDAFRPGEKQPLDIHCRVPRVARRDHEHFLDWLLERIQVAENHESREWFKVNKRVWDSPHAEHADRDV